MIGAWPRRLFNATRPVSGRVSATVSAPDADQTCAYCGSRIFEHDLTAGDACERSPEEEDWISIATG